jgi:nucleoside-diphosphate-sugar epimerase
MSSPSLPNTILVTGARGFIGSAVVAALSKSGAGVRAGARGCAFMRESAGDMRADARFCACNLDDFVQVRAAVAGADLIVHAAYGSDAAMAQQCRTLLEAMAAERVSSLIYLSSIAVYGERAGVVDEQTPPQGALGAYAAAKRDCEKLVREWAQGEGRAIILRPGIAYGTGSYFWVDKMVERIRLGAWGDFGRAGEGTAALVHIDDLVDLIEVAARRLASADRVALPNCAALNAVGPQAPSWNAYFQSLAAAIGAPRLRPLNRSEIALLRLLAPPAKIWRRLGLPGAKGAALAATSGELALFSRKAIYKMDKAADLLEFSPRIGLEEGLARTVAPRI